MLRQLPRILSRRAVPSTRTFTTSTRHHLPPSTPFKDTPSPPRLPKEEQEIFEALQRRSTGAFSSPSQDPSASSTRDLSALRAQINQSPEQTEGEMHPDVRGGAKPEFEGDTNPMTGEVGGPKNEPLRWGARGDWSFNGRVTDF